MGAGFAMRYLTQHGLGTSTFDIQMVLENVDRQRELLGHLATATRQFRGQILKDTVYCFVESFRNTRLLFIPQKFREGEITTQLPDAYNFPFLVHGENQGELRD